MVLLEFRRMSMSMSMAGGRGTDRQTDACSPGQKSIGFSDGAHLGGGVTVREHSPVSDRVLGEGGRWLGGRQGWAESD